MPPPRPLPPTLPSPPMARLWSTVLPARVTADPKKFASPPPNPSAPLPPSAWLYEIVLSLIVVVAPTHQLMSPPPTPAPARALPELPVPPTARLWVSVKLLAVREVPAPSYQPSLVSAPPMPQPT